MVSITAPEKDEELEEKLRLFSRAWNLVGWKKKNENLWEVRGGSRFSLRPDALPYRLTARIFWKNHGQRTVEIAGESLVKSKKRKEAALPWVRECAEGLKGYLRTGTIPPPVESAPRVLSLRTFAAIWAAVAAGIGLFWGMGSVLFAQAVKDVSSGALSWSAYPGLEDFQSIPWSVWIGTGGHMGMSGGLGIATLAAFLFMAGQRFRTVSEAMGELLLWLTALILVSTLISPIRASGEWIRIAWSLVHPGVLPLLVVFPWVCWFCFRACQGGAERRVRRTAPPSRAKTKAAAASAILVLCVLLFPVPRAEGQLAPPPTSRERTDLRNTLEELYLFHWFRDQWLLSNPVGRGLNRFYYTFSPYAQLTVDGDLYPDRGNLRALCRLGWEFTALAGLPINFLFLLGVGWRRWGLKDAAGRPNRTAGAIFTLAAAGGAAVLFLPVFGAVPKAYRAGDVKTVSERMFAPDGTEPGHAAHALCILSKPDHAPLFRKGMSDPDPMVRLWSATGLGLTGDPSDLDLLEKGLDDPEFLVRSHSAEAMRMISPRAPLEAVQTRIDAEPLLYVKMRMKEALEMR